MTDAKIGGKSAPSAKKSSVKSTLKCILVLTVVAAVCVALLAVANKFLQVEVVLDRATGKIINGIAPTGESDDAAYDSGLIKMVDLSQGEYAITDLAAYNKKYGSSSNKVRALYTSARADSGDVTLVVEAEGKGYVGAIVMLIAYDSEGRVAALATKSQSESFWDHIGDEQKLYEAYIGSSGRLNSTDIAGATGVTVKKTLGGITAAVNIANDFVARLTADKEVRA